MPDVDVTGWIWIPVDYSSSDYSILIDGVDQKDNVIDCEFTKAVAPEMGNFLIKLDNNSGQYTDLYEAEDQVELRYNLTGGAATTRFKGFIEEIKKVTDDGSGEVLELSGTHLTGQLLDLNVTETYNGTASADAVIVDLFARYFPTFTTGNVKSSSYFPKISWNATPFWDAVSKVAKAAVFTLYTDDSKDVHFFQKGTVLNENEAIVYEDNLLEIEGFGTNTADVKNKISVQGEDSEGLPVIYTSESSASQTKYRIKEKVIVSSDVKNASQAESLASSESNPEPSEIGKATTWFLPTLQPGDSVKITNPEAGIIPQDVVVVRFTHRPLEEQTTSEIAEVRSFAGLFKDRIEKEIQLEKIQNPYKLKYSFNLTFDDSSDGDSLTSTGNVAYANGEVYLSSGTAGTFVSRSHTAPVQASSFHLKVVGEDLPNASFSFSTDNGNSWRSISLEELTAASDSGNLLRLKIAISSANVKIKSACLIYA